MRLFGKKEIPKKLEAKAEPVIPTVKKEPVVAIKNPIITIIMILVIITGFIIAWDYLIMPDSAIDSIFYHAQVGISDFLFRFPLWWEFPLFIDLGILGWFFLPTFTYQTYHRRHKVYFFIYNPFSRLTRKEQDLYYFKRVFGKVYAIHKDRVMKWLDHVFVNGIITPNPTPEGIIELQGADLEVSEIRDTQRDIEIWRMLYYLRRDQLKGAYEDYKKLASGIYYWSEKERKPVYIPIPEKKAEEKKEE